MEAVTAHARANGLKVGVPPASTQYEIRRANDAFWISRWEGARPREFELNSAYLAVGWISNMLWTVNNQRLTLDYDLGSKYQNSSEVLLDFRLGSIAPVAYAANLVFRLAAR